MTFKTLLFSLFLYVCLVWALGARWYSGTELKQFGLLWTVIGLAAVLLIVLGSRVIGWWRLWRASVLAV